MKQLPDVEIVKKIVVATDGGPGSIAALVWVRERATRTPLDVEIVTVEETNWMPVGANEPDYAGKYVAALAAGKRRLAGHPGIAKVSTTLLRGDTVGELATASELVDLLVVTAAHVGRIRAGLRTETALHLTSRARCSLIVVPVNWHQRPGNIVLGVDNDDSSSAAMQFAVREAATNGRRLQLVHAWSPHRPLEVAGATLGGGYPRLEEVRRARLDRALAQARLIDPDVQITASLQFGDAADILVEAARSASLVVVGTHRRCMATALVLGSVSARLIAESNCVTAVVPPHAVHRRK